MARGLVLAACLLAIVCGIPGVAAHASSGGLNTVRFLYNRTDIPTGYCTAYPPTHAVHKYGFVTFHQASGTLTLNVVLLGAPANTDFIVDLTCVGGIAEVHTNGSGTGHVTISLDALYGPFAIDVVSLPNYTTILQTTEVSPT